MIPFGGAVDATGKLKETIVYSNTLMNATYNADEKPAGSAYTTGTTASRLQTAISKFPEWLLQQRLLE